MKRLVLLTVVVVLALSALSFGQSQPSAKATAAVADLGLLASTTKDPVTVGWTPILTQTIKTSNMKDLFINASLECGIYSDTLARSSGGVTDASLASGGVRVRVKVDDKYASPTGGYDVNIDYGTGDGDFNYLGGESGVSFCKRVQYLSAKLQGIIDLSDPGCFDLDPTTTCALTDEEIRLALGTLDANAFNFIMADLPSGVHTITVEAKLDVSTVVTKGTAAAKAFIGMGSVTIESVRMIKGEQVEF